MIRIQQIHLTLEEDMTLLPEKIIKKLRIAPEELLSWRIHKETFDARWRHMQFTYTLDCTLKHEENVLKHPHKDITKTPDERYRMPKKGVVGLVHRPIVVGFGPAGMFAALLLAQMGYQPLILERGECVEKRVKSVEHFWKEGILNTESNVQFGEGGAGTFSDGKLTTRVKDVRIRKILEEFVRFGAPEDILYTAHPHIGTDLLRDIVKRMREEILRLGAEIRFSTRLDDILIEKGEVCGVVANGEVIPCEQLILAIGHSARDTMRMLMKRGVAVEPKAFAVGARIEHPQRLINEAQYKAYANHPRLKAAEYRLTYPASNGRGVYTFCMCPGGYVVPSASMEGGVVVNGMSEHARDGKNANSALLVQIFPEDFGSDHPLAGMLFQRELEERAFLAGGGSYTAPVQTVGSFLGKGKGEAAEVTATYRPAVRESSLDEIFPAFMTEALREALPAMGRKLKGFDRADAVLTAVESRSSSPIRILRDKTGMSLRKQGIYPAGEGAGYAGGIVSAAVDGIFVAEKIAEKYGWMK